MLKQSGATGSINAKGGWGEGGQGEGARGRGAGGGAGGGGYFGFQVTRRCVWGHELKPKKSLELEAKSKNSPEPK